MPRITPSEHEKFDVAGKRERNKTLNRNAILDAARECFFTVGYEGVTVRDISRQSGLAAGTFYNYFTDKDELFKTVLDESIQDVNSKMHAVRMSSTTIEEFIHGAYCALFTKVVEDPYFFKLILRNEHAVRTHFADSIFLIPMRVLGDDVQAAIDRGIFPKVDSALLSHAFYGVAFEISRALCGMQNPDVAAAAAFATRLMRAGVEGFKAP